MRDKTTLGPVGDEREAFNTLRRALGIPEPDTRERRIRIDAGEH